MRLPSAKHSLFFRGLSAFLMVGLAMAVSGAGWKSGMIGAVFGISFFKWYGETPNRLGTGRVEWIIQGLLAVVAAGVLMSLNAVVHPTLSAVLVLALFASAAAARRVDRRQRPAR